jgi:beta-lactamase class C
LNAALAAYFEKAIASGDIVGAGVSIVKGDSIVIYEGFGKKNIKLSDRVDGETVFRLGSLSKGFSGVLAAKLKSEGVLDWSDKVTDYIPEFQLGDKNNTSQITLATILSQTSGAPYHSYTNLVEAGLPLTDIAKRFKAVTPISKPGQSYSYQNAMFALSGEMMEQSTHQDVRTLLNDRFFKPLDMHSISMDDQSLQQQSNVALPHSKSRSSWRTLKLKNNYYNAVLAGGINASALDMAKWMRLLLGHRPELMDTSALDQAFHPFIEIKGHSKYYQRWPGHVSSYYGFGWRIHNFKEHNEQKTMLHHGGSVNNYRNEIAVFPDADLGICVLLNSNSKLATKVIPDLYRIVTDVYNKTSLKPELDNKAVVTSTD